MLADARITLSSILPTVNFPARLPSSYIPIGVPDPRSDARDARSRPKLRRPAEIVRLFDTGSVQPSRGPNIRSKGEGDVVYAPIRQGTERYVRFGSVTAILGPPATMAVGPPDAPERDWRRAQRHIMRHLPAPSVHVFEATNGVLVLRYR